MVRWFKDRVENLSGLVFAELDASVQGWINHVRYADTWGLREHLLAGHPVR
ncbi:MAG: hypothetical protein H6631_02845 [Anaerolineaceae bacterium]|nr:hypothetical protein [Anaerolineaceae bacterium]